MNRVAKTIARLKSAWKNHRRVTARELMSGEFLLRESVQRQLLLLLQIATLSLLMLYSQYSYTTDLHRLGVLKRELQVAKSESLSTSQQLKQVRRQSAVQQRLQQNGSTLKVRQQPILIH